MDKENGVIAKPRFNKKKLILIILLLNWIVSVIVMSLKFEQIIDLSSIILMPLFWIFGSIMSVFPPLSVYTFMMLMEFPWNIISLTIIAITAILCVLTKDKRNRYIYLITGASFIWNIAITLFVFYSTSA